MAAWQLGLGLAMNLRQTSNKPEPVTDFGAAIPANPDLVDTQDELESEILANPEERYFS